MERHAIEEMLPREKDKAVHRMRRHSGVQLDADVAFLGLDHGKVLSDEREPDSGDQAE